MSGVTADLLVLLRGLWRRPALSSAVVATLAVGFAASWTLFGLVDSVLLRQLPYPQPDRVVAVWESSDRTAQMRVSRPDFDDFRRQARSFSHLAFAWSADRDVVRLGDHGRFTRLVAVSGDYFSVLGTQPARGRFFDADETRLGGAPAAVVTYRFWRDALGAPADLAGVRIESGGAVLAVVGVLEPDFPTPAEADLFVAAERFPDDSTRTAHNLHVIGRLRNGVAPRAAKAELDGVLARLHDAGEDLDSLAVVVRGLRDDLVAGVRSTLWTLQAATLLLLLLGVVNAANLLVARGVEMTHETAIRRALGAGAGALVRRWLAESATLTLVAAVVGGLAADLALRTFPRWSPLPLPRGAELGLHGDTLPALAIAAIVATITAALAPLANVLRSSPAAALGRTRGATASVAASRTLRRLAAAQMALVFALLVGGGLLARSLGRVLAIDSGLDTRGVLVADLVARSAQRDTPEASAAFLDRLLTRLAVRPEIAAAGVTNNTLFAGWSAGGDLTIDGGQSDAQASYRVVSGGTFEALGVPIVAGRSFEASDVAGAPTVAVVSASFAQRYFPDSSPLGARLRYAGMDSLDEPWMTVVGVAGDVRDVALTREPRPVVYVDFRQRPLRTQYSLQIVVRGAAGPAAAETALRAELAALDPTAPLAVGSLAGSIRDSLAERRLALLVLATIAALALLLAGFGLYSSLRYLYARRTREYALRLALGASPGSVGGRVAREALATCGGGIAVGSTLAIVAALAVRSQLYEVSPWDPIAWLVTAFGLAGATLVAASGPWRRALRLDPAVALRDD